VDLCIGEADQQATGFGGGWTADQAEDEEAEAQDLTPHWQYTLYNMSSRSVLQCNSSVRPAICSYHERFVPGRALQGVGYGRKYCRVTFGCALFMVFTLVPRRLYFPALQ
jgi:hypothetical protein